MKTSQSGARFLARQARELLERIGQETEPEKPVTLPAKEVIQHDPPARYPLLWRLSASSIEALYSIVRIRNA